MKNLLVLVVLALIAVSCGPSAKQIEEQRIADSIRVADSIAVVQAEQQRIADSITLAAAEAAKADSIAKATKGKKK